MFDEHNLTVEELKMVCEEMIEKYGGDATVMMLISEGDRAELSSAHAVDCLMDEENLTIINHKHYDPEERDEDENGDGYYF